MTGNPQVPPDGFFPTRRNPHQSFEVSHQQQFFFGLPNPTQNPVFQDSRPTMIPPRNNNRSVFFKTRPCKQFERGECPHGKSCTFAHGPGDLRQPPPNWQEIVARERFGDSQGQKHKICNTFYKGEGCAYGNKCTFLHVKRETGPQPWDSRTMMGGNEFRSNCTENLGLARPFGGIGNSNDQKTAVWKTKPCYRYEKFGRCVNGDECQYAHGSAELKKFGDHANFEVAAPSETLGELARDALSIKTEPIFVQENHEEEKLLEWKGPKKLSLVYGDWIYDHSS